MAISSKTVFPRTHTVATFFISQGRNVLAAIVYLAALNFKQMELYQAICIFFYLLASCQKKGSSFLSQIGNLVEIGAALLATFALICYPFLQLHNGILQKVVSRVFLFNRGLFEDYVANFWCSLNVFVKIRRLMEPTSIAKCCLLLTGLFSFPCVIHLYLKNSVQNLQLCLINVSMAFFLFSYTTSTKSLFCSSLYPFL